MRYAVFFVLILCVTIQQLLGSGAQEVLLPDVSEAKLLFRIPLTEAGRLGKEKKVAKIFLVNNHETNITNEVKVDVSANAVATSNGSGGGWGWGKNYRFVMGGMIVSYGYMVYLIKSMESYLEGEELWSNWRKGLSLSGLYSIEDMVMVEDLVLAIQTHYAGFRYVEEYKNPIKCFLSHVRKERAALQQYERLAKIIKSLPFFLSKIFFLNKDLLDSISCRKHRLDYFSSKIIHWMTKEKGRYLR